MVSNLAKCSRWRGESPKLELHSDGDLTADRVPAGQNCLAYYITSLVPYHLSRSGERVINLD